MSIGWADSGELSDIRLDQESKSRLRQRIQESYSSTPQEIGRITQQVFNFVAGIAEGDIVLPSDGAKVLGIGRVTGEYQYDGSVVFPHLRPVEWLDLGEWSLPTTEGLQSTVRELHRVPANLVEIERRILSQTKTPDLPKPSPKPTPRMLCFSTALEGNTLVLREVATLLRDGRAAGDKQLKDYLEVTGYADAAQWVYGQALAPGGWADGTLLTLAEVRHIHARAMEPVWGTTPHPEALDRESPGN